MDLEALTTFFMWCSVFNGGLLLLWTCCFLLLPDLVYRTQKRWFPLPRETFDVVMYVFVGVFKLLFLVFNLVPYLALLMIG